MEEMGKILKNYEEGRLTLQQAAKRAGISLWEIIDEVKKRHVHAPTLSKT